jgi:hypothetical protein
MTRKATQPAGEPAIGSCPVTFRASIPPSETAIKIHGEGGARIMLDIAESDLGGFLPALVFRGKRLSVTLTEDV